MTSLSQYERWKSDQQGAGFGAASIVLTDAQSVNPDQFAGDVKLGRAFGIPAGVAAEGRDTFTSRLSAKRNESILKASPLLTQWLRTEENAKSAWDDIDNLSWFERFAVETKEAAKAVPGSAVSLVGGSLEGAGQLLRPRDAADVRPLAEKIASAGSKSPEEIAALRQQIYEQGLVNPVTAQTVLSDVLDGSLTPDEAMQALEPIFGPALQVLSEQGQAQGEALQEFGAGLLPATPGMEESVGRDIGSGIGSLLAILGVAMATGPGGAGVFTGAAGAGEATSRARQAGQGEDIQTQAALLGVPAGLTELIPVGRLLNNPTTRSGLMSFLRSIGKQAMLEGGQEVVQEALQNAIAQNLYAPDQAITDGLVRAFRTGGAVGALVEAGRLALNAALPGRYGRMRDAAAKAEQAQPLVDQISGAAAASKLKTRLDDKFLNWVNSAVSGSPVEDVYVPAAAMQGFFQGQRIDPQDFIAEVPGLSMEEFRTALETGGDLRISTGAYAAKIAGTEFDEFFRQNMRFDPDAMTLREAQEFNERSQDALEEAYQEAERLRMEDENLRSFEQEIYDTMVSRLREAGRSTDVATTEAMLYPAFYRVMAERSGMTVEDFMRAYPLPQVRGDLPEGMQVRNVDALNRTLAVARSRRQAGLERRGPTLLEFISERGGINDPGGELRSRDAEVIKRGRGRKTFRLARDDAGSQDMFGGVSGYGLDDVARAAIEAGYLRDDPVAQEWRNAVAEGREVPDIGRALLAAVDRELAGTADYAVEADPSRGERDAERDQLEEYLASIGVSLDDSDDVIRAAVEADQAGALEQSGDVRGARGSIQFPGGGVGNGDTVIRLFQSADLSTFIHESGHYFLTVMRDLADRGEATAVADFEAVKGWWRDNAEAVAKDANGLMPDAAITADDVLTALETGATGDVLKDAAVDVGMQEQWARGFEAYLLEGKAPSNDLRSAFEKFRAWLLSVYRRITGLNVTISDDIRTVFDRMLASDQEIEAARDSVDDEMLFRSAADAGIGEDEFRSLSKLHAQARDEASQRLLREVMAPIRREREQWFRDERAKVREEVEGQVNRQRAYRALEWLGNRRWLGEDQPEAMPDMRLSKDMLVDRYGEGVLKTLPRGKFTVYAVEGGMDPDEVAGWFGFDSGDALIKALETATPRKEAIEAETDKVMRERHGDVLRDGTVEEAALAAAHGDKRGQFLAAELDALNRRAGRAGRKTTAQMARETARRTLSRMKVRDAINSRRYLAAERRAAGDALRAAASGDFDAAADAARVRLMNHSLYAESAKIAEEVEQAERLVRRLGKRSTRERLAGDYLGAIDEILDRYDFRKMSGTAEQRRGALLAYVQRMTEAGRENELAIPDYVLAEAKRTPYKQLSVEYLRGVVDSLKNIEHTARLKQKLIDARDQRDLDEVVDAVLGQFDANVKGKAPSRASSGRSPAREGVTQYLNLVRNADTILREVDGFSDFGAVYQNIKGPIDQATNELTIKRREAAEKFEGLYSVYTPAERRQMAKLIDVPELGGQFSKWDLISIAFNVGNEGNYQRLTDKRVRGHFRPEQIDAALGRLDERDADFVQSAWDLIGSYWPEIEAREKRTTGVAPERVAPRPVKIAGKELRGGYFPLKYDAEISGLARDDAAADLVKSMQAGRFGKAQTRNGHLKERAQSSGRPVLIDIGVLHGHVNQVVHDLAMSEAVNNSWKILQDGRVKGAFLNAGRKSDFDTLEIWLQDVAAGEQRSADIFNKLARRARAGFTVSKLAFNVSTVLLQPTGIAQSMVAVGKKNFLLGVTDMFRRSSNPWRSINLAAEEVMAVSPFMRERQSTFNKDIYDMLGDAKAGPAQNPATRLMRDVIAPLGFWMMVKAQFYTADLPTWFAAHRKAMDEGATESQAIAAADRAVARAQASGVFSDRSAIERGSINRTTRQSDVVRLFTALGSYMFAKFNLAYERTAQTDFRDPRSALIWASDMAMLFVVEGLLYAAIKGRWPDEEDDEDRDGTADEWAALLAKESALSVMSTLPVVREVGSAVQGYGGGGAYGAIIETLARPVYQAGQGELDAAFTKSVIDLGGFALMLPSTQVNRFVDATWGKGSEDQTPMEWLMRASVGVKPD